MPSLKKMAAVHKLLSHGYRTPMNGEMVAVRLISFPLLCWVGAVVGRGAASVVWGSIYGVGSRVISDDTFFNLQDEVQWWGGIAGLCSAVAMNCLPQLWPFVAFPVTYALSVVAGIAGGYVGWKYGLCGYFGGHAAVAICCILIAAWEIRPISRFSLRTLLIATTLVAVALGIVVALS